MGEGAGEVGVALVVGAVVGAGGGTLGMGAAAGAVPWRLVGGALAGGGEPDRTWTSHAANPISNPIPVASLIPFIQSSFRS
jgi:hypothetical protein